MAYTRLINKELKIIGMAKAKSIVKYRTEFGNFSKADDFLTVSGIGSKIIESIKDQLTFDEPK